MNIPINQIYIYIIDITLITFVIRGVYNKTTFIDDLTQWLYLKLNKGKDWMYKPLSKPFGCAFCMNFWIVFIYSMFYFVHQTRSIVFRIREKSIKILGSKTIKNKI